MTQEIKNKAKNIKLLILDVDGVLTDGRLYFDHQGMEYKGFHVRDGHGIKLLRQCGVEVAVISGRKSEAVTRRLQSLGIQYIYQGHEDKISAFNDVLRQCAVSPELAAHMGDDLPDLPIMCRVGFSIAVSDAYFAVKDYADWCTVLPGGHGAVREACDFILQAKGTLEATIQNYLHEHD